MIDSVRNILSDLASGKIKDERITLLADQLRDTERKLVDATGEISLLQSKIVELETIVENLEAKSKNREVIHKMKWGCIILEGDENLYCPACFIDRGKKVPTSRKSTRERFCASCKTAIPSG